MAEDYQITSSNGTRITFRRGDRRVFRDNGDLSEKGTIGNLPSGEACLAIVEDSADGTLVIDRMGNTIIEGVALIIENGKIVKVDGPDEKAFNVLIQSAIDAGISEPNIIVEFGVGTNAAAKYVDCEVEGEKMYGTVHFGIGGNAALPGGRSEMAFHHDGVVFDAKLEIDGRVVLDGRRFYV
jgi:leucyl aminopeptidase (aminopeptidase T)